MSDVTSIRLSEISKRYTAHWILKKVDYTFYTGRAYGIQGANGSGKSTLLKIISGYLSASVGVVSYMTDNTPISRENIYEHVSFWGPYVGLIKELTIAEMVDHFYVNKHLPKGLTMDEWYKRINLPVPITSLVSSLSSGQEQRLGLALTIMNDAQILLLDEPSSYLDEASKDWLYQLLKDYKGERIVLIASNDAADLLDCQEVIDIADYK